MTPDICGRESVTQFAFYDPESSCWRTWPAISLWGSEVFSGTWPRSGMTRGGCAFELPMLVRRTDANECSSLLGTPTASMKARSDERRAGRAPNLKEIERMLPTPAAWDGDRGPDYARANREGSGGDDLVTTMARLLPTPTVNDMGAGKSPEVWDAWTESMRAKHGNGNGHGRSLEQEALRLLPTPTADQPGGTWEQHLERKRRMPDGANRSSVTDLRMELERALHEEDE